jgi:hypothetical protein
MLQMAERVGQRNDGDREEDPLAPEARGEGALDAVGEAVGELSDFVQDALGLQDEPHGDLGGKARH